MRIGLIGGASGRELTEQIHIFGHEVVLIAGKEDEPGSDIADEILVNDLRSVQAIGDGLQTMNVHYVIIGTGHRFAFSLGEYLESRGFVLNINIHASKLAKEKKLFKDYIADKGFLTPSYVSIKDEKELTNIDSIVEKIGLPCVVKSTIDTMLPQKANCEEDLREAITEILASGSPVVAEQFVKGIDTTVFVSAHNGKAKALPICYYSKAEENEMKGFGSHEYINERLSFEVEAKVQKVCERLVLECGFEGLPRVDLMVLSTGEAYILETNSVAVTGINDRHAAYCRGTVLALREKGIDVAEIAVRTALMKFGLIR